jgi:hypothetical protein
MDDGGDWLDAGDATFETVDSTVFVGESKPPVPASALSKPCLLVRNFRCFEEAKRFARKAIAEVTSPVTLRPFGKCYQVAYHADSSESLKHYRDHCRYSPQEEHFIVRQYMMWTPLRKLAIRLDRKSTAVATWLASHGFREIDRHPRFGIGQIQDRAPAICREICGSYLVYDTAEILISKGVIRDLTPAQSKMLSVGCGIPLLVLTQDDKKRLLRFALDYNEFGTAYKLALDIGRPGLAYILALQVGDPYMALGALKRMHSSHPQVREALSATSNFIRFELATTLPVFLGNWLDHANVTRSTNKASSRWNPCAAGCPIIDRLLLVLGDSAYSWPPELLTIVRIVKHGVYTLEELQRSQNRLAAWLSADLMRLAAGREGRYNPNVQKSETKLAAFDAIAKGYLPNLPGLLTDLTTMLTYDHESANMVRNNMSGAGPYFVDLDPEAEVRGVT